MASHLTSVTLTDRGLEIEPIGVDAEMLLSEAQAQSAMIRVRPDIGDVCPIDPDIPAQASTCAILRDFEALRAGEIDALELTERLLNWGILRARLERGEIDPDDVVA